VPDAAATATRALDQLQRGGTTYTLTRTAATVATDEPWKVDSASATAYTVTGILADFTATERANTHIGTTDRRYLIAASGLAIVPEPGDTLTDDSEILTVVSVQPIRCKATDVLYFLHVGR